MSAGATLLKLQQIDLELARNKSELANMPELKELASKRKTYVKLKSEMTKLYAQRKDLDIELDDLNTTEIQTNNAIEAAKKRHVDGSDYREVQDLENELATLAKRLDKIEHTRKDVVVAHKEALDREARAQAIIAKFEEGVKADTKAARTKAADLQAQIDAATKERTALAATLPAVETIQGNIPTVCHTALQASSMSDLNHDGSEITHCPYCHRLLVLPSKEA